MNDGPSDDIGSASTTEGLPVSPGMGPALQAINAPAEPALVDRRVVFISLIAMCIAVVAALVARLLTALIGFVTNLTFYGRVSWNFTSPAHNHLGIWILAVPTLGGVVVGLMARYGSAAIRGHGIPEAMEQVLTNESRIPPRVTFLQPLSSAIAIGTGGPFGAEGPIIATGGAFGSVVGQVLRTTADERKVLLAAGAAAGMTATFNSPVSAVILAVELLLFEFRPRSIIPVSLACAVAAGVRALLVSPGPVFPMPAVGQPSLAALAAYVVLGVLTGFVAVGVTRCVYWVEDQFDRLPIHWMWWPAIGGLVVGAIGMFAPRTLGVGYDNIDGILAGHIVGSTLVVLFLAKFVSWAIALGSGTSGGTLAPLFTIGGGFGAAVSAAAAAAVPGLGIDPRIGAMVGMAAIFAGASRALLASVVFVFETTLQPMGLLPLLAGCSAAYLVSCLIMKNTIMTEKIARRGVYVPGEYAADHLGQVQVGAVGRKQLVCLLNTDTLAATRARITSHAPPFQHQGFPVVDDSGVICGVLTRRTLLDPELSDERRLGELLKRPPVVIFDDQNLRDAADHMVREGVGRLPVVTRDHPNVPVGIITRSDLLGAHTSRLRESEHSKRHIRLRGLLRKPGSSRRRDSA